MNNFSRGSEWRKWDLHIHTPQTKFNDQYKTINDKDIWVKFCEVLENSDVEVIGITDYFSIENYFTFIEKYKNIYPNSKKVFFPNIEFRLEVSVNKNAEEINIHIVFDNEISRQKIDTFLTHLNTNIKSKEGVYLKCSELSGKNFESAAIDYKELEKNLKNIFGNSKCYVIVTAANNTGLRPDTRSPRKLNISDDIDKISDSFFGGVQNIEYYLDEKRYGNNETAQKKPVISGCDAHSFEELTNWFGKEVLSGNNIKTATWIKADPTFDGLLQILNEPKSRVFIGKEPPIFDRVKQNRTKYIQSLKVFPVKDYKGDLGEWFNFELNFNNELVAIIGNKGSGKSAVSDIIALCCNQENQEYFSFLKSGKFRDGKLAQNFIAEITFQDETKIEKNLNDTIVSDVVKKVKYLPQGSFEKLCNEVSSSKEFEKEIESVVFQYIDKTDRLDAHSFQELITKKSENIDRNIEHKKIEIKTLYEKLITLDKKVNVKYKKEIEDKIKSKNDEIKALELPKEMPNPNEDEKTAELNKPIIKKIDVLNSKIKTLNDKIQEGKNKKNELSLHIQELENTKSKIQMINSNVESLKKETDLTKFGFDWSEIFELKIDTKKIDDLIQEKNNTIKTINIDIGLDESQPNSTSSVLQLNEKQKMLQTEQEKLTGQQLAYQVYLQELEKYKNTKYELEGNENSISNDTLYWLNKELEYISSTLEQDIKDCLKSILDECREIFKNKTEIMNIYRNIKSKVDFKILENEDLLEKLEITIDASFSLSSNFDNKILDFINKTLKGSFYKADSILKCPKNNEVISTDSNNQNSVIELIENILYSLKIDKREVQKNEIRYIDDQISDLKSFYDYLFSLDYLDYTYELKQNGKKLENLSPGEKGSLLLVFYLLLDMDEKPLILDQPEDNLDNESVAKILVNFIKKAKNKRQIIMVTHNPNLAVVSDAEQIVYVKIDKENKNTFSYESGSIENPVINKHIVDVLEGAMPAFNLRKKKYYEN